MVRSARTALVAGLALTLLVGCKTGPPESAATGKKVASKAAPKPAKKSPAKPAKPASDAKKAANKDARPAPKPDDAANKEPAKAAAPIGTSKPPADQRKFAPMHDGKPIVAGISYGPYRKGQKPGGPNPTDAQILEDLKILLKDWHMLRMYGSRGPTEATVRIIHEKKLPMKVMVGAWINPKDEPANEAEVATAIALANTYPDVVAAVSVGNESQVFWSWHKSPPEMLIKHLRKARSSIKQPVTTADDYNFWNKPESFRVAKEVDFILLHAYAMWNKQQLKDAVTWTADVIASIKKLHPDFAIVMGETGWATKKNPKNAEEVKQIKAAAGVKEQTRFYNEFTAWAQKNNQPYFYFSAFDEPWKGSANPDEIEKHWGLYKEDRTPKPVMQQKAESPAETEKKAEAPAKPEDKKPAAPPVKTGDTKKK